MSLENLLKTGQLLQHPPNKEEIHKLLSSAKRNLADAGAAGISPETRFDCAYKTLMQSALAALAANGYRPSKSTLGYHATALQSLTHSIGLAPNRIMVLDKLRKKRNLNDYTGADLDEDSARACMDEAQRLLGEVRAWLKKNKPELAGT